MTSLTPPSSQLGRRQHDFLVSHGYEFLGFRGGGHFAYEHPRHGMRFVSGTGYDAKGWQAFKSDMRKLFPGAFRERKSARPKREGNGTSQAQLLCEWAAERGWTVTMSTSRLLLERHESLNAAKDALSVRRGEMKVEVPDGARPKQPHRPKKAKPQPRQPWEPIKRSAA